MWVTIGCGMLTLLIAAIGKQKRETCKDYSIVIKGDAAGEFFLDKDAVVKLLKSATKNNIKGQPKADFNLAEIEGKMEKNVWIKKARLYFDNQAVLQVMVEERNPIARIFTTEGKTYYVDREEQLLPVSDKVAIRLPVFTGFPDKKKLNAGDSALLHGIDTAAQYINSHPFWTSQVAQVNIVPASLPGNWEMEMVPVVGNHTVKLGDEANIPSKFDRLFTFYKQVLSQRGLDAYKTIDVRFDGQVVAGKSENPKVDSVLLRKNVETMLEEINVVSRESDQLIQTASTSGTTPVIPDVPKPATVQRPRAVMPPQPNR